MFTAIILFQYASQIISAITNVRTTGQTDASIAFADLAITSLEDEWERRKEIGSLILVHGNALNTFCYKCGLGSLMPDARLDENETDSSEATRRPARNAAGVSSVGPKAFDKMKPTTQQRRKPGRKIDLTDWV
jgi:hypothetical protein